MSKDTVAIEHDESDRRPEPVPVHFRDSGMADWVAGAIEQAELSPVLCRDVGELCNGIEKGAGCVVIEDEALCDDENLAAMECALAGQPAWSDLPLLLVSDGGPLLRTCMERLRQFARAPLFMVVPKSLEEADVINFLGVALRLRRRQYETRELIGRQTKAEEALSRNEEWWRLILDNAVEHAILSTDPEGRITSWNVGAERVLGYRESEVLGESASLIFTEADQRAGMLDKEMHDALRTGCAEDDRWHVRKDGSRFWANGQVNPIVGSDGTLRGFLKILRDYTGQRRNETWLKALNEILEQRVEERTAEAEQRAALLRRLADELTTAEQRERRRLARVLHDHLQQLLVAAKMQLGTLLLREKDSAKGKNLRDVEELLERSIDTSRSLTVELSPPILYDGGLAPAIEWLGRRMYETHGLEVEVIRESEFDTPDENVRVFVFEAVRELFFNVVKHAGVKKATVRLGEAEPGRLTVAVSDSGKGFDADGVKLNASGFGLFSIRERLEFLGGAMEIDSEPENGTRVVISISVTQPVELRDSENGGPSVLEMEKPPAPSISEGEAREEKIRILLADDHKILREGLAGLLREQPDFEVVSEASDGQMAVEMAHETRPDIIIMDVSMPKLNGVDATRRVVQEIPNVKVIALSMHEKEDMASAMREAGAVAYVTKGAQSDILTATIRDCAATVQGGRDR